MQELPDRSRTTPGRLRRWLALGLIGSAMLGGALAQQDGAEAQMAKPSGAVIREGNVTSSRTHEVEVTGFAYRPAVVTVMPGDSVRWLNRDLAPHTATERMGGWDTGEIGHGEVGVVTFSSPGRHVYFCTYHPHITAEVLVAEPRDGAAAHDVPPKRRTELWP